MTMAKVPSFRCPVTAQADNFRSFSDMTKKNAPKRREHRELLSDLCVSVVNLVTRMSGVA
jgi:hypothetical protein